MGKKDKARFFFGLDILLLSHELEGINGKDTRNDRAAALIKRAAVIYINGGNQYHDMVHNVALNALSEYQNWYHEKIYKVVMQDPTHLMIDGDESPVPKYDVNKYKLNKYFDGLNKEVFEELQKLILFLKNEESDVVLKAFYDAYESSDDSLLVDTRNFFILAHSILVGTLEGGEFLSRLEKIFAGYGLSDLESKELNEFVGEAFSKPEENMELKDKLKTKISIAKVAKDFLSHPLNN